MENSINWQIFWQGWRNKVVEHEDDLYYQVGLTVNKKPIEKKDFHQILDSIADTLELNSADVLVELCCGNGLATWELKERVKHIFAADFTAHLIEAANTFKSAPGITYIHNDVIYFLDDLKNRGDVRAQKYLMNNSLAYFNPKPKRLLGN